jgi:hypothetical protein
VNETMAAGGPGTDGAASPPGGRVAQQFCLIAGVVLFLAGLLGFLVNAEFEAADPVQGATLLGFEVNGWHNIVHLGTGAFLLAMGPRQASARTGALAFGCVYAVVTLYGLVDGDDVLTLLPINAPDNLLHVALTLAAIAAALAPTSHRSPDRGATTA